MKDETFLALKRGVSEVFNNNQMSLQFLNDINIADCLLDFLPVLNNYFGTKETTNLLYFALFIYDKGEVYDDFIAVLNKAIDIEEMDDLDE